MQTIIITIETNQNSKLLEITTKRQALKKRYVKTWTADEDEKLVALCRLYPKKWNLISQKMRNRNQNQCLHRYRRICRLGDSKKIWSPQEDAVVMRMIEQVGNNWRLIAQELGSKSGKQIRQRFINKLDPIIKRQEWTLQQDIKIIELYAKTGSRWCQISKGLPGRPQNKIKNRFYSYIQKNYEFKLKDHSQQVLEQQSSSVNENHRPTPGITTTCTQKTPSNLPAGLLQQKPQNSLVRLQKQQVVNNEIIQEQLMGYNRPDLEKQNKQQYSSLKQINDESFYKYNSGVQNCDLFYFEDN